MEAFSDIPKGIIRKIAVEHLDNQEDFEAFRKVCSNWRSETEDVKYILPSKSTQLPWLMLVDSPTNSYRRFYSLTKHMYRKFDLPKFDEDADDHRRYLSSKGWLIGVTRKRAVIHFVDIFSSRLIKPPSVPILSFQAADLWDDASYSLEFTKFIFSQRPSSPSDDFEVAMIFDTPETIAFWRPGQQEWIKPVSDFAIRHVEDVCFFRGEFYSIDFDTRVIAYGGNQSPKHPRIVTKLKSQGLVLVPVSFYIVEFQSTLLVINRKVFLSSESDSDDYGTESFELFQVNVEDGKARQIEGIGDKALFVGYNSTFMLEAADERGCRPNCIYFTDDNPDCYCSRQIGGIDMGVFCFEQRKVVARFYQGPSQFDNISPPIWVQLPGRH